MMMVFIVALVAISLYKVRVSTFHSDCMERPATSSIKGIFAVSILLSHLRTYMVLPEKIGNKLSVAFFDSLESCNVGVGYRISKMHGSHG